MELLENVRDYLQEHALTLATAESCTAGMIVSELARVPGSGQSIDCGLAVYSPDAKQRYLSVSAHTIEQCGLTSEATSKEMALGALTNNDADVALANTGIAGPEPHDGIPVGTVCFAWAFRHEQQYYLISETRHFSGDRNEVRLAAAHYALMRLPEHYAAVVEGQVSAIAHQANQAHIQTALQVSPTLDPQQEVERRVAFLYRQLVSTGQKSLVLGISGGVDSTVAGRLAQLAVEKARQEGVEAHFYAMRLPYDTQQDEEDAQQALAFIQPDSVLTVNIQAASDALLASLEAGGLGFTDAHQRDFVLGNIKARQRMVAQYAVAGANAGLVVGTDQAAEALMGFFTKYGDGACDIAPLTGLTKAQVRQLGAVLGAPEALVEKQPTADLETLKPQLADEEALGVSYADIDAFLTGEQISEGARATIIQTYQRSAHKRQLPITP
ncbi:ammonia-dependent NAD(+) synthetase [Vreelandella aquamarina]|uniref:ammonia-dependent NAD(+) synthetase n=1 Tax=Vreelandella aquamarina TaxID=77097 RepID=UPI003850F0F7